MFTSTEQIIANSSKQISQDSWMMDLDPLLEGGYKVLYYRPFPVELRYLSKQQKQIAHRQIFNMRIMVNPSIQNYSSIKIQITSQSNLFICYLAKIDQKKFDRIKKSQSLNFNYNALFGMLIRQLNLCEKDPEQYTAVFNLNQITTHSHKLHFTQNIQYKSIELLSLDFEQLDQQLSQQSISYRFSNMKAKNQRMQTKIKQMYNMIKLKNPNLLQTIVKKSSTYPILSHLLSK